MLRESYSSGQNRAAVGAGEQNRTDGRAPSEPDKRAGRAGRIRPKPDDTDNSTAVKAAEKAGFTGVTVTGKHTAAPAWNGCSESDAVAFDMKGTNPQGKVVAFKECCGWSVGFADAKGCTARF